MKHIHASTLHSKVFLGFLFIAILSLAIIAISTRQHTGSVDEIHEFLDEYANKQTQLIDNYMKERTDDALVFSQNQIFKEVFLKLEETFFKNGMDSPVYLDLRARILPVAQEIINAGVYENILMITQNGDVIFSAVPGKLIGSNLFTGSMNAKDLSQLVRTILETKAPSATKSDLYSEGRNQVSGFAAAPIIEEGNVIGVLAFRFSTDSPYPDFQ